MDYSGLLSATTAVSLLNRQDSLLSWTHRPVDDLNCPWDALPLDIYCWLPAIRNGDLSARRTLIPNIIRFYAHLPLPFHTVPPYRLNLHHILYSHCWLEIRHFFL